MSRAVTFAPTLVGIPDDVEGATRVLAQISKPGDVTAVMRKLRNFVCILEGERPFDNRSRDQVFNSISGVWKQLRHSIKVGDWFDRLYAAQNKHLMDPDSRAREYASTLKASLAGRDPQTVWKPYLPVAHMAAGFRITMFEMRKAQYFVGAAPRAVELQQVRELLYDDHSWLRPSIEAAEARLMMSRVAGMQMPAETRHFVITT